MRFRLRTLLKWFTGSENSSENPYRASQTRLAGHCSFCGRNYRGAGPLAEGPHDVYICRRCVQECGQLIDNETKRLSQAKP